jgi:sugar lactone lactonase YvrE
VLRTRKYVSLRSPKTVGLRIHTIQAAAYRRCMNTKQNDNKLDQTHTRIKLLRRAFLRFSHTLFLALLWFTLRAAPAQTTTCTLGTTTLLVGPVAGTGNVVLGVTPSSGAWTASANAAWLHLSAANQSGTGSANVVFTYDSNTGAPRAGTLTLAGQTLNVTQAGSSYLAAESVTGVLAEAATFSGLAADGAGNLFFADSTTTTPPETLQEWTVADNTISTLGSGFFQPEGVAVDAAGNVYVADTQNEAIEKWTAASNSMTTVVSSGLHSPEGVAVDKAGNLYIADTGSSTIKEWMATDHTLLTLISSGLNSPEGVAVDGAGNVYIADTGNVQIEKWTPTNNTLSVLVSNLVPADSEYTGIPNYYTLNSVAVDILGNVYFTDSYLSLVYEWVAAWPLGPVYGGWVNNVSMLVIAGAELNSPEGVAVDGAGNVYFSDTSDGMIKEWVRGNSYSANPFDGGYITFAGTVTTLLAGDGNPWGVGVDGAGNVYFADRTVGAIKERAIASQSVTTLVSRLKSAAGIAVDSADNVYVADSGDNAIKKFSAGNVAGCFTTVVSGLNQPNGVALDPSDNVYVADTGNNAIKEWNAATHVMTTLVSSGLNGPQGVAVDAAGNVYIADTTNGVVKEWLAASAAVTTLVATGLRAPVGVAVTGSGNVFIADCGESDTFNSYIFEWSAMGSNLTLVVPGQYNPFGMAVDSAGNAYFSGSGVYAAIQELSFPYVDAAPKAERAGAGYDALPAVLPATQNTQNSLLDPYEVQTYTGTGQTWLAITGITNDVVSFSFATNPPPGLSRTGYIDVFNVSVPIIQARLGVSSLGKTALFEGSTEGSDSVIAVAPQDVTWTNTANADWLHLSVANQSGTGSTNVFFSYDANSGSTRSGTLTIGGLTLNVTQAGSTYVAAEPLTTLTSVRPWGVAVDGAGNVYLTDPGHGAIRQWNVTSNAVTTLVSGLGNPTGVAVDGAGNVYFADAEYGTLIEWTPANNATNTLASGMSNPRNMALDPAGNVYIADVGDNKIWKWTATNGSLTPFLATGLNQPYGVAVDQAGNVYIAEAGNNAIEEWFAANNTVIPLAIGGLSSPLGVAVDGSGNVYIADYNNNAIKKWTLASNSVTTIAGVPFPTSVAVDGNGNIYMPSFNFGNDGKELPYAFVDATPKLEGADAANDVLPVVLPATENLLPPFAPTSDQSWLTITGITNGVVSFSVAANPGASRLAHVTLLGRIIPVTQSAPVYSLGATALVQGPAAGSNSIVLGVTVNTAAWTATANTGWLHLNPPYQSGTGSANVIFSFDANPGAPRTGTLTIAGQTVTVTQAGSTYVAAGAVTTLVSSNLDDPWSLAVDGTGNVYIADTHNSAIKKWSPANNTVSTLVSSNDLNYPYGVAVDGSGNLYIADQNDNALKKWTAATSEVSTLASGLNSPQSVAVDGAGNVYLTENGSMGMIEWTAFNSNTITLMDNYQFMLSGVALDAAGNVYFNEPFFGSISTIEKWTAANNAVTTLVSTNLQDDYGVAVDGSGNVYIADSIDGAIKKWTAANSNLTILVSSTLDVPAGVAVDGTGNVYFADTFNSLIKELPYAFVDATPKSETAAAGNDALPGVLPATENLRAPFAPTSDQSWLAITGTDDGVVSFSFTANASASSRTAHITLLGQTIPVTQAGSVVTPTVLTGVRFLGNGILQFTFTNNTSATFTVLSTTNLAVPLSNWTEFATLTNDGSGVFQFISPPTTNDMQRFYLVRSP